MARKKKSSLDSVLETVNNLSGVANKLPDLSLLQGYDVVKRGASDATGALAINSKQDKIRVLLIEIGDRICSKDIKVEDKNVMAEVECINELNEKINVINKG